MTNSDRALLRWSFPLLGCLLQPAGGPVRPDRGVHSPAACRQRRAVPRSGSRQRRQDFLEQGFGWADRARRIPADEHTLYSLASISKPFTATALMTLVE